MKLKKNEEDDCEKGLPVMIGTALEAIGLVLTFFFNFQATIGPNSKFSLGFFHSTITGISAKYPSPIGPAGYAFSIWGIIYLWMALWVIYIITTIFRKNSRGPVYLNPPVTSLPFLLAVLLANTLNVLWLFAWDRQMLTAAAIILLLTPIALYVALTINATRVRFFLQDLLRTSKGDLWAYRVLVGNGVAIYSAWTTIAAQVALSVYLVFEAGLSSDTTVYICLSILAAELIIYFFLDVTIFDSYTRYIFTIYPVFIWALAAVVVAFRNDTSGPTLIYSTVLLGVSCVFFVIKSLILALRPPIKEPTRESGFKFTQLK